MKAPLIQSPAVNWQARTMCHTVQWGSMFQPMCTPLSHPTSELTGPAASYVMMSRIRVVKPR